MNKLITASIFIVVIGVWYFYPCFTYKGTYSTEIEWKGATETSTVTINDQYNHDDVIVGKYTIKPRKRILLVDVRESNIPDTEYVPVKLGWNKITPLVIDDWMEFKKQTSEP